MVQSYRQQRQALFRRWLTARGLPEDADSDALIAWWTAHYKRATFSAHTTSFHLTDSGNPDDAVDGAADGTLLSVVDDRDQVELKQTNTRVPPIGERSLFPIILRSNSSGSS